MALDKLVDSTQLDTDLTSVANAIRTKGGTSAQLAFPAGFVQAIADIPSGGGGTASASGTFTMAADGTPPVLTHNLHTQKIAVLITPASKITASAGYRNFYVEYINTEALCDGETWTFDWTSYNTHFTEDETVTLPDTHLRVAALHTSPWITQSNWYSGGNPAIIQGYTSGIVLTDDTVQIKGGGNNLQWAKGTYSWTVWKLG